MIRTEIVVCLRLCESEPYEAGYTQPRSRLLIVLLSNSPLLIMLLTFPQVVAYVLTCVWGIARASLCFKYNAKLRKALGP